MSLCSSLFSSPIHSKSHSLSTRYLNWKPPARFTQSTPNAVPTLWRDAVRWHNSTSETNCRVFTATTAAWGRSRCREKIKWNSAHVNCHRTTQLKFIKRYMYIHISHTYRHMLHTYIHTSIYSSKLIIIYGRMRTMRFGQHTHTHM